MSTDLRRLVFVVAAMVCGLQAARADVFLREDFSDSWDGLVVEPINQPVSSWAVNQSWGAGAVVTYLGESAGRITVDETAKASIISNPGAGYTKPTKIGVTARLTTNCPGTDNAFRGAFVGFSDDPIAGNVRGGLWGIRLRGVDGEIALIENNSTFETFAYVGAWDPNSWHDVSFVVATDGGLSNVVVDGENYPFTRQPFTDANTNYVAFYASSQAGGGYYTWMDFLQLESLDNSPPVALCQDATVTLDSCGVAILDANAVDGGSSDPDGDLLSLSVSPDTFACGDVGPQLVTLTVADGAGPSSTCQATVTVSGGSVCAGNPGEILREDFCVAWDGQLVNPVNDPVSSWSVGPHYGGGAAVAYLGEDAGRIAVDTTAKASLATDLGVGYTKPAQLYVRARLTSNCPGTDSAFRGGFIGFSSTSTGDVVRDSLWGIRLRGVDGEIALIENNATFETFAYLGAWDANQWHLVEYAADTTTGAITDVIIDGELYPFSRTPFTDANTNNVAFYAASQSAGANYTWADWLEVYDLVAACEGLEDEFLDRLCNDLTAANPTSEQELAELAAVTAQQLVTEVGAPTPCIDALVEVILGQ